MSEPVAAADAVREQTRTAYDTVAVRYARMLPDAAHEAAIDLAMVELFVTHLRGDGLGAEQAGGATARVLDAGCGAGRMIGHLLSLDPRLDVSGVDLSPGMLEQARAAHPGVAFTEADLARLPIADAHVDGVLAWYSIIHTAPQELVGIFTEFRRVLRPDGVVLVGFHTGNGEERAVRHAYGTDVDLRAWLHSAARVAEALGEAGLVPDTTSTRRGRALERFGQGFILARRP